MTAAISVWGFDHIGVTVPVIEVAAHFLQAALSAMTVYDVQRSTDPSMTGGPR